MTRRHPLHSQWLDEQADAAAQAAREHAALMQSWSTPSTEVTQAMAQLRQTLDANRARRAENQPKEEAQ
jgi:hypothetical protein